jgi:hypothetical protein
MQSYVRRHAKEQMFGAQLGMCMQTDFFIYICWRSFEDFLIFHVNIRVTLSTQSVCPWGTLLFGSHCNNQTHQEMRGGIGKGGIRGGVIRDRQIAWIDLF